MQTDHWPNLLQKIIAEMINNISKMDLQTLLLGITLISKLFGRLSPNFSSSYNDAFSDLTNLLPHKSPPSSPLSQNFEYFTAENIENNSNVINNCIELSTALFTKFVDERVLRRNQKMLLLFQKKETLIFDSIDTQNNRVYDTPPLEDEQTVATETFEIFCRYLVQLSCFPTSCINENQITGRRVILQIL